VGCIFPEKHIDVYAAIGVEGENDIEINFGGSVFRWKDGNDWAWKIEGQVGCFAGTFGEAEAEELPRYELEVVKE
jgi:Ran-binding protein 9/10